MAIRLLYGLTKELLGTMRKRELDDVARRLQSTAEDAAGQMGKKAQKTHDATREAVEKEQRIRKIRDEEYKIMMEEEKAFNEWIPKGPVSEARGLAKEIDDDIVQATWETGGWIPGTKNPAQFVPEPENIARGVGGLTRASEGMFARTSGGGEDLVRASEGMFTRGGTALPEFTSSNLSKTLSREGVDPNMDKLGWGGRLVSQASSPTKYTNITLESLNPFQREVYKTYSTLKNQADFPKELSHPGVLADLLEEAGRVANVGELKAQIGGNASKYISDYWRKKGPMIRKEWNTVQETGDFTTGTSFEEIIEGIKRID